MSGLFQFSVEELLTFFAVLVRFSVLFSVLPFVGDRMVPVPVKILFSLAVTVALFPSLVKSGVIHVDEAKVWGKTVGGIIGTITLETLVGLVIGFVARLLFDVINFAANLSGTLMGLASASTFDPHQETQTQVVAEIQLALAMLMFLVLDGHYHMLEGSLQSYEWVALGGFHFVNGLKDRLIQMTGQVFQLGLHLAAPVAIAMFAVNIAFGVVSKAMPQMNVLVLSFAVTTLVGLLVLLISSAELLTVSGNVLGRMQEWIVFALKSSR